MYRSLLILLLVSLQGCVLLKEKERPDDPALMLADTQLTPDQAKELTSRAASNWFFGQGLGRTALTVGTIIAFPPFGLIVAGNAALDLSGYEQLTISEMLPEEEGRAWSEGYDTVTSLPGQLTSTIAGERFRTDDDASEDVREYISSIKNGGAVPAVEDEPMKARLEDSPPPGE